MDGAVDKGCKFNEHARRCRAKSKSTGRQCKNPAAWGYRVCRLHGAHGPGKSKGGNPRIQEHNRKLAETNREAMQGNKNSLRHGLYSDRLFIDDEERAYYQTVCDDLTKQYNLDDAADSLLLHELALNCVRAQRARAALCQSFTESALDALMAIESRIGAYLAHLSIRRDKRRTVLSGGGAGWIDEMYRRIRKIEPVKGNGQAGAALPESDPGGSKGD